MATLGFGGIGALSATFKLDSTTVTAIGTDYDGAKGKGVTLTDNDTVGFGVSGGSALFGIIEKVESNGLATILIKGFKENVAIKKFGTTPAYPSLLELGLGVIETGQIVKLASGTFGTLTSLGDVSGTTTTGTILL